MSYTSEAHGVCKIRLYITRCLDISKEGKIHLYLVWLIIQMLVNPILSLTELMFSTASSFSPGGFFFLCILRPDSGPAKRLEVSFCTVRVLQKKKPVLASYVYPCLILTLT